MYPRGLYPWAWVPKQWTVARNKGIWDPKPRVTKNKGTNLKSLIGGLRSNWFCRFRIWGLGFSAASAWDLGM